MPEDVAGARPAITDLLRRRGRGDREALDRLMPLVCEELHRMAARCMTGERTGHPLQRTAPVHEACVPLVDRHPADWRSHARSFGVAAQAMRRIPLDHARSRRRAKRRAGAPRVRLNGYCPAAHLECRHPTNRQRVPGRGLEEQASLP